MIAYFETINLVFAALSIVFVVLASVLVVDFLTSKEFTRLITKYGLLIAFIVTLGGMLGSLFYSEVYGFIPCGLCWFQRIFLFSQVFILGTALYFKARSAEIYGITLSSAGLVIAIYQHYLQMGGTALVSCPTAGQGADCAQRFLYEFGFVTLPLMSAFIFIFLIALYVYLYKSNQHRS